jgi:hypothetical protein
MIDTRRAQADRSGGKSAIYTIYAVYAVTFKVEDDFPVFMPVQIGILQRRVSHGNGYQLHGFSLPR